MTRELCRGCGRISAVGFSVPDTVWWAVMGHSTDILCLACFTARADDAFIRWDEGIQFYPVSLATFLAFCREGP